MEETMDLPNGTFSWEMKNPRGHNGFTAKKQRKLAYELYGKRSAKLAYDPEMIDRSGW